MLKANELFGRINKFDFASLHPEIAARARQILGDNKADTVLSQSKAAAAFYAWVMYHRYVNNVNFIINNVKECVIYAWVIVIHVNNVNFIINNIKQRVINKKK